MKKKVLSGLLWAVMAASLAAGCSSKSAQSQDGSKAAETTAKAAEEKTEAQSQSGSEVGKLLISMFGTMNSKTDMKIIMLPSFRLVIRLIL